MLTLQFGQCGNQLGHNLFTKIMYDIRCQTPQVSLPNSDEYIDISSSKWFEAIMKNGKRAARAILIDTERKVIDKITNNNEQEWYFKSDNIIISESTGGSANNWAFGYSKKGPDSKKLVLETVRKELEQIDRLDTFLCLLSCAGGTGSGLGSYTIQTLRDIFPTKTIMGIVVFPFSFGEVATQNYNIILSLARIVEDSDIVIVLENHRLYAELLSSNNINFPSDINDIACQKLLSVLQPATDITNQYTNHPNYIISKLTPHPTYKLATIEAFPLLLNDKYSSSRSLWQLQKNPEKWQLHFKSLKQKLYINYFNNYQSQACRNGNVSEFMSNYYNTRLLSNILITRGSSPIKNVKNNFDSIANDPKLHHHELNHNDIYTRRNWFPSSERFTHFHHNCSLLNYDKFSSIITNSSRISKSLDDVIGKAWDCYTYGAFLHQYKAHGLEDDDFLGAFSKIEYLNSNYKNL